VPRECVQIVRVGCGGRGGEDGCVARSHLAALFTMQGSAHDGGAGRGPALIDQTVDELDEILWESHGDLRTHIKDGTMMGFISVPVHMAQLFRLNDDAECSFDDLQRSASAPARRLY